MKKNMFMGLFLIAIAVLLLLNQMGWSIHIPIFTLLKTFLGAYLIFWGIEKRCFKELVLGLGVIYCQLDNLFKLSHISHLVVIIAAFLIGAGLDMMLQDVTHKKRNQITANNRSDAALEEKDLPVESEDYEDEIHYENNFGTVSKYINSQNLRNVRLENNFGCMNVYMENAVVATQGADIRCESNFGEIHLYLPKGCRVEAQEDTSLGSIDYEGNPCTDDTAPIIFLRAEAHFGHVKIFFG